MDLTRAKVLLKKMNRLVEGMDSDDHLTAIEKDLMRAYLRDLYDFFLNDFGQGPNQEASGTAESTSDQLNTGKEIMRESESEVDEADEGTSEDDLSIPRIQPESDQKQSHEPERSEPQSPEEVPVQTVEHTKEESVEQAAEGTTDQSDEDIDQQIEELFDIQEGNELSERLSHMPIRDLSRAMGLNERIYTINELFGGDHALFDEVLETLNNLESFKEAREYLTDKVAKKYDWTQPDKKKKAHHFIRLVRRRYKRQVV